MTFARAAFAALLLGAAFASIAPANAQSRFGRQNSDCILDNCRDRDGPKRQPSDAAKPDREPAPSGARETSTNIAPGRFDFYVLSLSWSPAFCATGGDDKGSSQCDRGGNLGFVLHGLWPQYDHGFPSDCDSRSPSSIAMQAARGVWPDDGLARYEWRKHGTCTGKAPADYFADARKARDSITIPDALKAPKRDATMSPNDIQRAFISENPRLRPGMMAVACQRGMLQEVRICLSKDLRDFRPCPEVARQACRSQQISIPQVR